MGGTSQILGIGLEIWSFLFALIAIVVSVAKEIILPIWLKPDIKIVYGNDDECIYNDMTWYAKGERYIFSATRLRLKIVNAGRISAKGCYVKLTAIRDDKGDLIKPFDPCPLIWTVFNEDNQKSDCWKIDLAKKEHHLINLAFQLKGNHFIGIRALSLPPALRDTLRKSPPGKFKFDVTAYGDNFEPVSEQVDIVVTKNYTELKFDR